MQLYTSLISALVIAALAIFVNEFASQFDEELNACGLGTFTDGACVCKHPYVGQHCEISDCGYGRLINSLFESNLITTPNPDSDLGCACESQWWGYSCANCTSRYPSDCSGPCLDNYYGARCDILCLESTAADAQGVSHEEAGGVYNFYVENQGICLTDGSVRCNPGRAGSHCEFQCLDCEYGSCNLNDGTCDCFAGYYGDLCNATCPGRCSGNNGICQDDGTCACDAGFTGDDCSLECCIRDGGTAIGRVHGSCNPTGGCSCDAGWVGPNCDCNDQFTCSNRGTCSNTSGTCVCEDQFQGARCEMCADFNIGPFCEYDRYQCPSREQQNGEFVAVNTRGDYRCKCNAGFTGSSCEECISFAYPKNGTEMCSFVIPASLCNRGTVKNTYQGTGLMCDCELNFDPATDCASCNTHFYGSDCEIECGVLCTNSGGICESTGCTCPQGKSSVNGVCEFCGGDTDCQNGDCENGRCQCNPGFYGDDCSISAPSFQNKVCNGYQSELYFETAECETDAECLDISQDAPLANQQVAYRAQQYDRVEQTFCHRLDIPLELKDTVGCCVDANFDGFCDAANLLDDANTCTGEMVSDICNQRSLEGEVNIFDWCTSQSLGCTMNGACVDPVLCEDRCDAGLNSSEWIERWEYDHLQSMESVMNETWKFPIHFDDPYTVRSFYIGASLDDVCPAPTGYNFCRDALIPPDATVFNATYKYVDGWEPMPSFHTCELQHHVFKVVNGTYLYNFSTPIWAGNIEMVSNPTQSAAFGRLGQNNASYYGETNHFIDSLLLFGRGDVEVIIYNYTTDSCVDLMKRSATHFTQCKQYAFYEFEYDWDDFCTWKDTVVGPGGFEQRCYDQSLVCAGCENWQEGCENLPLVSEYPFPMPDPCTPWSNTFCDEFLNVTFRPTGTCAYTECNCEGYGVGGPACSLQCAVPQFTNSDSACGSGLDPPWGRCEPDRGAIAFGFEQGRCNCFNGGDPNLGCALVCTNNDECSEDIDTPFTFDAFNCSEFQDLVSFEPLSDPTVQFRERCHVNLRDSVCNYWRGRCECATPYTYFTLLNQSVYSNMGSYRIALMQGYDIEQYQPFTQYFAPTEPMIEVVNRDTLCWDPFKYPVTDSFVCDSDFAYRNTDTTFDEDQKSCKDYTVDDCGKIRNSTILPLDDICPVEGILDKTGCLQYAKQSDREPVAVKTRTNRHRSINVELGRCEPQQALCEPATSRPMYAFQSVWDVETEPRCSVDGAGGYLGQCQQFAGCDQHVSVCDGSSASLDADAMNYYTTCCKRIDAEFLKQPGSETCVPKDATDEILYPYKFMNDISVCENEEGYESITTEEECQAVIDFQNLMHLQEYGSENVDANANDPGRNNYLPDLSKCTHDIIALSTYTSVGSGYCDEQYVLLPDTSIYGSAPLLNPGDTFYDVDRNKECMNRCIDLCRGMTHFFIQNVDDSCVCATGCDNLQQPADYEAYKINLGSNPTGDPEEIKGCYFETKNYPPEKIPIVKFNPYTGVNYVTPSFMRNREVICKRKGFLGSQAVSKMLTCGSGCSAISYAGIKLSSQFSSTSGGDGNIMQDCLMVQERTLYDQNEITVGSGMNFLVWDLEDKKTSFGVEISTNMRQIRPNVMLSPIYTNDVVVVSVYHLDKDTTIDAAVSEDWTFIQDYDFELKPDKPPTLTVSQGQCAGEYTAGAERTTVSTQYDMVQQWGIAVGENRRCEGAGAFNTAYGTEAPDGSIVYDTTSLGGADASPNPKQACADWCNSQGYAGFNTAGPMLTLHVLCECATCATLSVVADTMIGHLITSPAVVAEKTPLELQGDWYNNGKRIQKSHVVEYKFSECADVTKKAGARCTRAMSKSNCIASMNENEACVQYTNGYCTTFCKSSVDCCDGNVDVAEDAGFAGNYAPTENLKMTDTATFYYKPDYSCCGEEKHYFYFAQGFCDRDNIAKLSKPLHLPGPDQHPLLPQKRSFKLFDGEAFELTPEHPLYREDKKEECALRCKEIGATEFFIIYKYTHTLMPEERCHCNDRIRCEYLVQSGGITQYKPSTDTYSDPEYPEYSNTLKLRMESYMIVDPCTAVDAADVSFGCHSPYTKVTSPNAPFNDVVHQITATGDASILQPDHGINAGWVHETLKLSNADGYFKLFSNNVPHLMTEKCAYNKQVYFDSVDSRFLKFMVSSENNLNHAVVINPTVTTAEVILSDEKSGCVDDGHEIKVYDFMKTNITKKRYACKYSLIASDEICTNGVQFSSTPMGILECADSCGSAFHMESNLCYCAPFACTVRTASPGANSYNWEPNDCGFQYLSDGYCSNSLIPSSFDLHLCRSTCLSLGKTAFSFSENPNQCRCCVDTDTIVAGSGATYTLTPVQDIPSKYVRISDKSCEHYGHRTILDEDTCKRAAIEFGGSPENMFSGKLGGRCVGAARTDGEIEDYGPSVIFEDVLSREECAQKCAGKFTIFENLPSYSCACVGDCTRVEFADRIARFQPVPTLTSESLGTDPEILNVFGWSPDPFDNSGGTAPIQVRLVDIDNDGDLDLFLLPYQEGMRYYENDGTPESPHFQPKFGADNPLNNIGCGKNEFGGLPAGCATNADCFQMRCSAAFGDVDGDGDIDVLFGRDYRDTLDISDLRNYYKNVGTPEEPAFEHVNTYLNPFEGIEFIRVWDHPAMPIFWDWDNDGDLDLFVGKATFGGTAGQVLYYENSGGGNPTFTAMTGSDNPLASTGGVLLSSAADIDGDGTPEFFSQSSPNNIYIRWDKNMYTDSFYSLAPRQQPFYGLIFGSYAFGDLYNTGSLDCVVGHSIVDGVSNYGLLLYRNYGNANFENFRFPDWPISDCHFKCFDYLGFSVTMDKFTEVTCKCSNDLTLSPATTPTTDDFVAVYKPFVNKQESYRGVNFTTRGCSMNGFTAGEVHKECEDCICEKGDSVYQSPYVEVTSGTCETNGYIPIGLYSRCFHAIDELGYDFGTLPSFYFGMEDEYVEAAPLGCSYNTRPYFGDGSVACSAAQKCLCQRTTLYQEVTTSTCRDSNLYGIRTANDCLAASVELNKGTDLQSSVGGGGYTGCVHDAGTTSFLHDSNWAVWFEWVERNNPTAGNILCRKFPYGNDDYVIKFDDTDQNGEVCDPTYVLVPSGNQFSPRYLSPIQTAEECERAVKSLGLATGGLNPQALGAFPDQASFEATIRNGCGYYMNGQSTFKFNTGQDYCSLFRPCICKRQRFITTSDVFVQFPLLPVQNYIDNVESKYVVIDEGATCGSGFSSVGDFECDTAKNLFGVTADAGNCDRLCKHEATQCEGDEVCICRSNDSVTVFDSNESCVICGGGEEFTVGSYFLNENGNTRGCVQVEDENCLTSSTGWTQYRLNPNFGGNESVYTKAPFTGYCTGFQDIPGEYDGMIFDDVIDHCQRLCRAWDYFSVNRDACKCTHFCNDPFEPELWQTFQYQVIPEPVELERAEFLRLWDNRDPNIECYKDLEHTEWVDCEWIRALKHFARGSSYRVGDCHHVGPGVGEGINSQIPCSGHGFLSSGTCACDYAENLDLKDTGVGMTFEFPTLRETPFRGRNCSIMCPGYDLKNMESVCSGHGRCETDGRCACDQGFTGFKCHLSCETETEDLTCSGHGVCNIVHQPVRDDIYEAFKNMDCNRSEPEVLFLQRDRVIQTQDAIYHMYFSNFDLLVDIYMLEVTTRVYFTAGTGTAYIVGIDDGEIQGNPTITVCRLSTLVKTFDGYPLNIIDDNGNFVVYNWTVQDQTILASSAGEYTYYATGNPEMSGKLILEDCPDKISRNATIDDFYIKGLARRLPYQTVNDYPYMACEDIISVKREEAVNPILDQTTEDVFIDCALQSGMAGTAYTVICAECACSYSRASGHWTGYDCRTPALGFLSEDGKTSCPAMVDKEPCNGRGTCNWGSVDGLGLQIPVSANCFCGDPSSSNFSIIPRNLAGDLMIHANNFGVPLYVDAVRFFEGDVNSCPEGLQAVPENECDFTKDGNLVTLEATITVNQEFPLTSATCAGFDPLVNTEVINRVSASGELVTEGAHQEIKCAAACFSHYKFKANGKIGGALMFNQLDGTFEENVQTCGFTCMNRNDNPNGVDGINFDWAGFSLTGFSVNEEGQCYCETFGPVLLDADWRYFEYVFPYKEIPDSGLCLLNNVLVFHDTDPSVPGNPGQNAEERVEFCARTCQLYRSGVDSKGFSYLETNSQCYCEMSTSSCALQTTTFRRFDFTQFNIFEFEENTECKCGRSGSNGCFSSLNIPDVFPNTFTLSEPRLVYENFVCRRNGNQLCKPADFILKNFVNNCACKMGFAGPLCEDPRMMCIYGGEEIEAQQECDCRRDGVTDSRLNKLGCCPYGMYWSQDRYTTFSPLTVLTPMVDNQFYIDALNAVCKPPSADDMQSPGEDTENARTLRVQRYVATTNDYELLTSVPCTSAKEVSLFKAVYVATASLDLQTNLGDTQYFYIDETTGRFSTHNVKMMCLDHCTVGFDPEPFIISNDIKSRPRSFRLRPAYRGGKYQTGTVNYIEDSEIKGEPNDLHFVMECSCSHNHGYIFDESEYNPPLPMPFNKMETATKPRSDSYYDNNRKCAIDPSDSAQQVGDFISSIKYASGNIEPSNCKQNKRGPNSGGVPPEGRTITSGGQTYGLRLTTGEEGYIEGTSTAVLQKECAFRCGRSGYDVFWIQGVGVDDTCTCLDSGDLYEGTTNQMISKSGAYVCNVYPLAARSETCTRACFMAGYEKIQWQLPNGPQTCECWYGNSCDSGNYVTSSGDGVITIQLPHMFRPSVEVSGLLNYGNSEAYLADIYDIVYPVAEDNMGCFQTETEVLEHVDPFGLDGTADADGYTNKIGVPYTMIKRDLTVKSLVKEANVIHMELCYAFCSQAKAQNSRINSLALTPTYETIDMVYAGPTPGIPLPRCWGPCTSDSDCETGLTCQTRDAGAGAGEATGIFGCKESADQSNQWDNNGGTMDITTNVCAVTEPQYLGNSYNNPDPPEKSFKCQCIEDDEDHECNLRNTRDGLGECINGVIQGLPFTADDPHYNSNKIQECHERCLRLDANTKAFYVSSVDFTCGCATGYCQLGTDTTYQVYDIAPPFGPSCDKTPGYLLGSEFGLYTEPFVATKEFDVRPPNPMTCNIESYLHLGSIIDSGHCECPIYDFEVMYGDTENYENIGNHMFRQEWVENYMEYAQLVQFDGSFILDTCKLACNNKPGCTELSYDSVTNECHGFITDPLFYNNIPGGDFVARKISDRSCTTAAFQNNNVPTINSVQECWEAWYSLVMTTSTVMENHPPVIRAGQWDPTNFYCGVTGTIYNDVEFHNDDHFNPRQTNDNFCTGGGNTDANFPNVRTIDAGFGTLSGAILGAQLPTYVIIEEAHYYDDANKVRLKKKLLNEEINRYCPTGEIQEYEEDEDHEDANPHQCMQRCRENLLTTDNDFVLSRGDVVDGTFHCMCSFILDESCILSGPSVFHQYKVHKHSGAYTSIERLLSARDPQVGKTTQCKCQGYYLFKGKAISCPTNTFKNSGHCTSSCENCPAGKFSEIGSTFCDQCPAGKILTNGACSKCDVGEFASIIDNECQLCPLGRFNTKFGQGKCEGCPAGWFDNDPAEGLNCDMCSIGRHTAGFIGLSDCIDCPIGYYNEENGISNCTECPTGRANPNTASVTHLDCAACLAGKFQDVKAQATCKDCQPGKSAVQTARLVCADCDLGKFQSEYGISYCLQCNPGQFGDAKGLTECKDCAPGKSQYRPGEDSCTDCSSGTITPSGGMAQCQDCPIGRYQGSSGQSSCTGCPSKNPGGNYNYVSSLWFYGGTPDRITKDKSCDSHFIWTESNRQTIYYWSTNSDGKYNFDCINFMSQDRGGGARSRRPCWTGDSNNCNTFACNIHGDCSGIWFRDYVGGGSTKIWCYPGGDLESYGWVNYAKQIKDL